jgi:DNA/RNA-binding domain of Phe-tRNA-synthetase-like protein
VSDIFLTTPAWRAAYPGAQAGVLLIRGAGSPAAPEALAASQAELERRLRERYAGQDRAALLQDPVLSAYAAYYKQFKKTYHVQLQLESVIFKGRALTRVAAPLVQAMFMAELEFRLLTAGHDLASVALPATLDVARGSETYVTLRGEPATLKAGDMYIADGRGILSSILYGPDQRTPITAATRDAFFTVYAPPGIAPATFSAYLEALAASVRQVAPEAVIALSKIYGE